MTARNHHYVPQCYLKGFARYRDNPKLFVVDAKENRTFCTAPANVAVERDFHKIDIDGHPIDALENAFSKFEGELSESLKNIIASRSIKNYNDRVFLFNLIGLMSTKNPRLRENMRKAHEHSMRVAMDLITATPQRFEAQIKSAKAAGFIDQGADVDYKTMREFLEKEEYKIELLTTGQLQRELKIFDKILPLIFHRKWMLFKAPPGTSGFVTSDHPVCLMWSDPKKRGGFYPPGLALLETQIVFPVSNELVLIGAFEIEDDEVDADKLLIAQINGSIILHSTRQVYARDSDFLYKMQHNSEIMRGADLLDDQCMSRPVSA